MSKVSFNSVPLKRGNYFEKPLPVQVGGLCVCVQAGKPGGLLGSNQPCAMPLYTCVLISLPGRQAGEQADREAFLYTKH